MSEDNKSTVKKLYEDTTIQSVVSSFKEGATWTAKKAWNFSPRSVWEGVSSTASKAKNAITPNRKPRQTANIDVSDIDNINPADLLEFFESQLNISVVIVSKETGEVINDVQDAQFVVRENNDTSDSQSEDQDSKAQK